MAQYMGKMVVVFKMIWREWKNYYRSGIGMETAIVSEKYFPEGLPCGYDVSQLRMAFVGVTRLQRYKQCGRVSGPL